MSDAVIDIVPAGFDAGIQLGEVIDRDMAAVPGRVLSTDSTVNIRLARDGLGLTIVYEDQVRDEIARGELVPVLEAFCEPFAGYSLYYPQRRHASPALRALIDHLRGAREAARNRQPGGRPPAEQQPIARSARPRRR